MSRQRASRETAPERRAVDGSGPLDYEPHPLFALARVEGAPSSTLRSGSG